MGWLGAGTRGRGRRRGIALGVSGALFASLVLAVGPSASVAGAQAKCDSPGVTADEIKVGVLHPQTGATFGAQFLPFGAGVKARLGAQNDAGGVGGRKLVAVDADDQGDPTTNFAAARKLVEDDEVLGVVQASPAATGQSAPYFSREGIPVTGWPINFVWGKYPNMFGYAGSTSAQPDSRFGKKVSSVVASFLKDHGATNMASVGTITPQSAAAAKNLAGAFRALKGDVGYLRADLPTQPVDYTADATAMKEAKIDTLSGSIQQPNFTLILQAARQAGNNLKVVYSPTGYDQRLLAAFGKDLAGAYFSVDWAPFELELPGHKQFDAAMAKYSPGSTSARSQLAMVGWLSADLFIRGLEEAGAKCPTRAAFIKNLRKVKDYDAGGLLPNPVNEQAVFGKPSGCQSFMQVAPDGSKFVPVDGDPDTAGYQSYCGKLITAKD